MSNPHWNNSSELPFAMSTHSAWMLLQGLEQYAQRIATLRREKLESEDYLELMIGTAVCEATKLKNWFEAAPDHSLLESAREVDELLADLRGGKY